jgi:hypothetical protein
MDRPIQGATVTHPDSVLSPVPSEQSLYAQARLSTAVARNLSNTPNARAAVRMCGDPATSDAGLFQQTFIEARRP